MDLGRVWGQLTFGVHEDVAGGEIVGNGDVGGCDHGGLYLP